MCGWGDTRPARLRCACDPGDQCGFDDDPTGDTSIPLVGRDLSAVADPVDVDPLGPDPHAWPRSAFMARPGH